jgi:hypothetical protein
MNSLHTKNSKTMSRPTQAIKPVSEEGNGKWLNKVGYLLNGT